MVIIFAVALVIVNNAIGMAVLQRVKEIGTMRAVGAQRRFVLVMLLVEAMTLGVVFGLVGHGAGRRGWSPASAAGGGVPASERHHLLPVRRAGAPSPPHRRRHRSGRWWWWWW